MKSTGNDIVALKAIDILRTNLPAFYSKIITLTEHELSRQPEFAGLPFEHFVWLLWSVKESVYKYLQRLDPGLVFSPTKIIVQQLNAPANQTMVMLPNTDWESDDTGEDFYTGEVLYLTHHLHFRSKITADFIASVVNATADFKDVYWGIRSIDNPDSASQSAQVRASALKKLKFVLSCDQLLIDKTPEDIPVILKDGQPMDLPVSFAHHHHFVTYSFAN